MGIEDTELVLTRIKQTPRESETEVQFRKAKNFTEAIRMTVLHFLMTTQDQRSNNSYKTIYHNTLTEHERSIAEHLEDSRIDLLLDVDGVLVKTKEQLIKLLKSLLNFKKSIRILRENIPFSNAKLLYNLIGLENVNTTIITDRIKAPLKIKAFPFFNSDTKLKLEKKYVKVFTNFFKMFRSGEQFLDQIQQAALTYYIGSGYKDKILFNRIQKAMRRKDIAASKLIYIEVKHTYF